MAVHRTAKRDNYTQMDNRLIRDKRLSLKAKGLLAVILSLPENWNYSTQGLAAICKEGSAAIRSALRELEDNGYLVRVQKRLPDGRQGPAEYEVFEIPQINPRKNGEKRRMSNEIFTPEPAAGKTTAGKPADGKTDSEEPDEDKPGTEEPYAGKPLSAEPDVDFPPAENSTQLIKEESMKEEKIKEELNTELTKKRGKRDLSAEDKKHLYGSYDNVYLTDGELEKLKNEFPGDYEERIERLSEYMASTGKSYRSALATIRSWARRDRQERQKNGGYDHSMYTFEEGESL